MDRAAAWLVVASLLGACTKDVPTPGNESARAKPPAPAQHAAEPKGADVKKLSADADQVGALPAHFDERVTRALALPMAEDVALALLHVAAGKSPTSNYRWTLNAGGALHYVQRSRDNTDWQAPFDRPLPDAPSLQLEPRRVEELLAQLRAVGFFEHPGYEGNTAVEGGSYYIIRARDGGSVKTVVLHNVKAPFVETLTALSDPLWTQDDERGKR